MKVIHITPSNGYEIVDLLANRYSKKNKLAVIKKDNNESFTGGIILSNTQEVRDILDNFPKNKQYNIAKLFKIEPFVKEYFLDE